MFTPKVHVDLPDMRGVDGQSGASVAAHFAPMTFLLEGLSRVNQWHIDQAWKRHARGEGLPIPPLYASGVRYQEDPFGQENWRDIPTILEHVKSTGRGVDCDQLLCWRIGELWHAGIACEPVIKWQHLSHPMAVMCGYPADKVPPEGVWLVHCMVRYADGTIEDPSKILGMGGNFTNAA